MSRSAPTTGPTAVYRLWDAQEQLLYVGLSQNPRARYVQHEADKTWWPAVQRHEEQWFGTRAEAETSERTAIGCEAPLYNRTDERGANRPPHGNLCAELRLKSLRLVLSLLEEDLRAGGFPRHRFLPTPVELARRYGHAARDVVTALDELQKKGLVQRVSSNRYVPAYPDRSAAETARGLMLLEIIDGLGAEPFSRKGVRVLTGRSAFVVDRYITDLVSEGRLEIVGQLALSPGDRKATHYVVSTDELDRAAAKPSRSPGS